MPLSLSPLDSSRYTVLQLPVHHVQLKQKHNSDCFQRKGTACWGLRICLSPCLHVSMSSVGLSRHQLAALLRLPSSLHGRIESMRIAIGTIAFSEAFPCNHPSPYSIALFQKANMSPCDLCFLVHLCRLISMKWCLIPAGLCSQKLHAPPQLSTP